MRRRKNDYKIGTSEWYDEGSSTTFPDQERFSTPSRHSCKKHISKYHQRKSNKSTFKNYHVIIFTTKLLLLIFFYFIRVQIGGQVWNDKRLCTDLLTTKNITITGTNLNLMTINSEFYFTRFNRFGVT